MQQILLTNIRINLESQQNNVLCFRTFRLTDLNLDVCSFTVVITSFHYLNVLLFYSLA